MPEIRPFRAVRYDKDKTGKLSSVIAPPYDVISKKMQDELYKASPYNFVRLELNKITSHDGECDNRYTRAKDLFDKWMAEGILTQDAGEAVYIYAQKYKSGSRDIEQLGFIALMGLDTDGRNKVYPHENTLASPKEDRLNLIRLVKANLSPIFVLYEDKKHSITTDLRRFLSRNRPIIDVGFEGVKHRVWKVEDGFIIDEIRRLMSDKDIFIADGHHRYEVSRMYNREACSGDLPEAIKKSAKYIMVYFVEMDDCMLTVLPAHRLVKDTPSLKNEDILEKLKRYFYIEKVKSLKALLVKLSGMRKYPAYGMYMGKGGFYAIRLKSRKESDDAIKDKPREWKRLDVSILHLFVFQNVLGISDSDDNIDFLKSPEETVKAVDTGKFRLAFFLNPTKVSEVKKIASLGERMPRKATYFYPKPLSGLVINKF